MRGPVARWPGLPLGAQPARAVDLTRRHRDLQVTLLDAQETFAAVARHQGAFRAYRLEDASAAAVLLVAVRSDDTRFERTRRDFADDCQAAGVNEPAALWEKAALPRWLRKLLDASG